MEKDKLLQSINDLIVTSGVDKNKISDSYHTFEELYEHRIILFIALAKLLKEKGELPVWKSLAHSDGSKWDGWFILGIGVDPGTQITYHLPISKWDETNFIPAVEKAADWDKHTSEDVLIRLKVL